MKNEFVTYEQALVLKELGFNEECFAYYYNKELSFGARVAYGEVIECPLKQQVLRWFRDRYLLDGLILPQDQSALSPLPLYFMAVISYNDGILKELFNTTNIDDLLHYSTYEEAENACIDKLIEIAKQQDSGEKSSN